MDNNYKYSGFRHFIKAAGYSISGFKAAWVNEAAFRQEVILALFILPAGFILGHNAIEKALLMSVWLLVIIVELLNSAIEAVVDRAGLEHHHLAGRAKDLGSSAVFMSISLALLVWILILSEHFLY